jgi:uncharacterized membrane protein
MRVKAAHLKRKSVIQWRSHEPSRIETFSDAAFAFALTLIIVSIEVPKSFDDLMQTMKGTLSFAVCFAALFNIWNNQNIFFRRYGLSDSYTIALNAVLLFVVLIYTYPLKFLFELVFSTTQTYMLNGHEVPMIREGQTQTLMLIYGAGFIAIYILFYLMYRHAQHYADELSLTPLELFETKTATNINLICICVCAIPMSVAAFIPAYAGDSGFIYCLIPVSYSFWFSYRGRKRRELFPNLA